MGKSIITKHTTFCLCDKHNKARLSMFLPMQYSLADILYIISEYTGYKNNFSWNIYNPYRKELAIKNAMEKDNLEHVLFSQFRDTTPVIIVTYGSSCIMVGTRNTKKYSKVYPYEIKASGCFPIEEKVSKKELPEKLLYDYNKLQNLVTDMSSGTSYRDDDAFNDFQSAIITHFKDKYHLTNEIIDGFFGKENRLKMV